MKGVRGMSWAVVKVVAGFAAAALASPALSETRYDAATRVFRLDGGGVTYAFGVSTTGVLKSIYWGPRLASSDTLAVPVLDDISTTDPASSIDAQEFASWGGAIYTEPAFKIAWPDGVRDAVLRYRSFKPEGDGLAIELADTRRPIRVTLHYTIDTATGVVGRWATISNDGSTPIRIDQAFSAAWSLPVAHDYRLHYLTGQWAAEWMLQERPITPGSTVIESRRGITSHQASPWFAIDRAGLSGEESGPVWFGALGWSGSWRISIDQNPRGDIRVTGGLNPFDFSLRLQPRQSLDTPVFYGGYSDGGMGGASRLLHRFELARVLPGRPEPPLRPVLYDSWEATGFAVDATKQIALAERAARVGVERFVMDDGWFGQRNSDRAGLGDWVVNDQKFPHGLAPLINRVHELGMDFGLWVEPEMVSPDSDLYRAHPDWVLGMAGRQRTEERHQLVLNLARTDVRDHVYKALDDLLNQNSIQFLKWDNNRDWAEAGWPELAPEDQQAVYVKYIRNLYWIIDQLRTHHPGLEIESCAGGGGRVDLGVLQRTDEVWTSDNTDPFDRLTIQDGFTHAFTPAVMMAWVTDSPNWANNRSTSLRYRFLSAMQGGLGVGADLGKWTDAEMAEAGRYVSAYKQVRRTVQRGDLYRLVSPRAGSERSATFYVARDRQQAVLFTFLHSSTKFDKQPAITVRGLDPAARYRVRAIDRPAVAANPVQSGAYWMANGIDIPLTGDFQADARIFEVAK